MFKAWVLAAWFVQGADPHRALAVAATSEEVATEVAALGEAAVAGSWPPLRHLHPCLCRPHNQLPLLLGPLSMAACPLRWTLDPLSYCIKCLLKHMPASLQMTRKVSFGCVSAH